jgi:hypothetical protein
MELTSEKQTISQMKEEQATKMDLYQGHFISEANQVIYNKMFSSQEEVVLKIKFLKWN